MLHRLNKLSYRNVILSEAAHGGLPVAYWPLDEVNGTAAADLMAQASGTGFPATYSGSFTQGAAGPINGENSRALNLAGAGFVQCGNSTALCPPAMSFECWVNLSSLTNAYTAIVSRNDASGHQYQLFVKSDGKMAIYTSPAFYDDSGTHTLSVGQWYHLAFTYNSVAGLVGYVNGVIDHTLPAAGAMPSFSANTTIGEDDKVGGRLLSGSIAHAWLWPYALTADRIKYHYLAGLFGINRRIAA